MKNLVKYFSKLHPGMSEIEKFGKPLMEVLNKI